MDVGKGLAWFAFTAIVAAVAPDGGQRGPVDDGGTAWRPHPVGGAHGFAAGVQVAEQGRRVQRNSRATPRQQSRRPARSP